MVAQELYLPEIISYLKGPPGLAWWSSDKESTCGSVGKESACNEGDLGLIPGLGRSPGEGNSNPLQHSCLEMPWTEEPCRLQPMGLQSWT